MDVEDVEDNRSSRKSRSSRQSSASSASGPKLKQGDFSPTTWRLANSGKASVRERIALVDGFPKDKDTFIWESLKLVPKDNNALKTALQTAQDDMDRKEDLIEYA